MTSILQLQLEGGYNPLIYMLQLEGSSNSLVLLLQPPFLAPSCHPDKKVETELLNHQPHWSCGPANQCLYYTAQSLITAPQLYHTAQPLSLLTTAHQPVQSICPINLLLTSTNLVNLSLTNCTPNSVHLSQTNCSYNSTSLTQTNWT